MPAGHAASLRAFVDGPTTPQRIQFRRSRGWAKPVGAVVVTLPHSRFANPYPARKDGRPPITVSGDGETPTVYDRVQAVELFRAYLRGHPELVDAARRELAGRDLACWCRPHEECHADELLRIAAGGKP